MALIEIAGHSIDRDEIQHVLATDHPLVAQFRFELVRQEPGCIAFSLHIVPRSGVRYLQQRDAFGHRVAPTWRTLDGSAEIGQGNRVLSVEGGQLVAENSTFFPHQEYNDLGIGSALYVAQERLYRRLGIRRVSLFAVDVGIYVWARQGFAFLRHTGLPDLIARLEKFVAAHAPGAAFDRSRLRESWDLADFDLPGIHVDGDRIGKAFMLAEAPPWPGVKLLDDEQHSAIAEASRRETFARLPDKIEGAPALLAVR